MAVVIETGAGVRGANAYADRAFVTTYLTDQNRQTENLWSTQTTTVQDAKVVAATAYIERRWANRFLGTKEFSFDDKKAEGSIVFAGLPSNTETFVLGTTTYTFVTTLSGAEDEILIGATAAATASNTQDALVADADNEGTTYGTDTVVNRHVTPTLATATITLVATADGASGNFTALTGSPTNVALTAPTGGLDGGSQTLSFPRAGLYDRAGRLVEGVPLVVKQAMAEYAVRSVSASLFQDPTVDAYGGSISKLREKVGPIEVDTEYVEGTHLGFVFKAYPEADRLLEELLRPRGVAVR